MLPVTLASLRMHKRRFLSAGLAIVIGVGFTAATFAVGDSTKQGMETAIAARYVDADVVVSTDYLGQLEENATDEAAQVDGVGDVAPLTIEPVDLALPGVGTPETAIAGDLPGVEQLRWHRTIAGGFPEGDDEVVLSEGYAESLEAGVGDRLTLTVRGADSHEVRVSGLLDPDQQLGGEPRLYTAPGVLGRWSPGGPSELLITTGTPDEVVSDLESALNADATVQTGRQRVDEQVRSLTGDIAVLAMVFLGFAAVAMFVAGLVIANTFSIVGAQRSRDLALLRCVGAERAQLLRSVLVEAAVVAVVSSVLGVLGGVAAAMGIVAVLDGVAPIPFDGVAVSAAGVALPVLVGVLVTMVAAVLPARRATRVSPLAALRPEDAPRPGSRAGVVRTVLSVLLLGGGGGLLGVGAVAPSLPIGMAGGVLSFLGVLAAAPIVVPAVMRTCRPLLRRLPAVLGGKAPGRLAVDNAVRQPKRTAAATSALLVGVTLIALMSVGAATVRTAVNGEFDTSFPADLVTQSSRPLPHGVATDVAAVDGVRTVLTLPGVVVGVAGQKQRVLGVDSSAAGGVLRDPSLVRQLREGRALVPWDIAGSLGVDDGDRMRLAAGRGSVEVEVQTAVGELGAVMVREQMLADLADPRPLGLLLRADDGVDAERVVDDVEDALTAAGTGGAQVSGGLTSRALYDSVLRAMLLVASGLLGVAVLIALVGVGNTLSLSVVERTRENALLRALGLTRRQLRGTIAVEAALMSLVAVILGSVLGTVYGWAGARALLGEALDGPVTLTIPWSQLGLSGAVALLAGLVASVLPARRAVRVAPAVALADE